ncbi:MAG: enoyl-CoA hydratase/isomerase family protein [Pyrinomonadaceae bacterium]|nr:enoyl-CoA hydratase/isomerase family protein [Pyrinomonadaceae bacterium]
MSNGSIIEIVGDLKVIRFSRPEIRSPLSISVLEDLHAAVDAIGADSAVAGLIFTGMGDVFASGADLREIAGVTAETAREFALRGQTLMSKVSELHCPTVAAVNGFCFGGALDLALACTRRIASPNALFAHPGATLGIITGWGGTQRLPRLIGEAAAIEIFFTGRRVTAAEALGLGLVDSVSTEPLAAAIRSIKDGKL